MMDVNEIDKSRAIQKRRSFDGYPQIYARLAEKMRDHLMHTRGLSEEEATAQAVEMMKRQAGDTIIGLSAMDIPKGS